MSAVVIPDGTKAQFAQSARLKASTDGRGDAVEPALGAARAAREELFLLTFRTKAGIPSDDTIGAVKDTVSFDEARLAGQGELSSDVARAIAAYFTRAAARTAVKHRDARNPGTRAGGYLTECHAIADRYRRLTGGPVHSLPIQLPELAVKGSVREAHVITVSVDGVVRVGRDAVRVGVLEHTKSVRWRVKTDSNAQFFGWTTVVASGGREAQMEAIRAMVGNALLVDPSAYVVKFTETPDHEINQDLSSMVAAPKVGGPVRSPAQVRTA